MIRGTAATVVLVASATIAACGTGVPKASEVSAFGNQSAHQGATPSGTSSGSTATTSEDQTSDGAAGSISSSESDSGDLLLARQTELTVQGGGGDNGCEDPQITPTQEGPEVWLEDIESGTCGTTVSMGGFTLLHLHGFRADEPISLDVRVGGTTVHTRILTTQTPLGSEIGSPRTLFREGEDLIAHAKNHPGAPELPAGVFLSNVWQFVPPESIRVESTKVRALGMIARQGALQATHVQRLVIPSGRQAREIFTTRNKAWNQLLVIGFSAGEVVPIGLYRQVHNADSATERYQLVGPIGKVAVPNSGVAEFTLPERLATQTQPGNYCLLPPVGKEIDGCARLEIWPDFPGEVTLGDQGDKVLQWQRILIQNGTLDDTPENRDGIFDQSMSDAASTLGGSDGTNTGERLTLELYNAVTGKQMPPD